ncbi:MAG: hypothetical protein LBV67_12330, partial [Streptococcaceae bacterium]|nr:hypothetical protein [Streptococcaceae bacterium]
MFNCDTIDIALVGCGTFDLSTLAIHYPPLFSKAKINLSTTSLLAIRELITAIESVVVLPSYRDRVLTWAPPGAGGELPARSVFFGYDFHLVDGQPKLIEINTNAGGGLLNTCLLRAHGAVEEA